MLPFSSARSTLSEHEIDAAIKDMLRTELPRWFHRELRAIYAGMPARTSRIKNLRRGHTAPDSGIGTTIMDAHEAGVDCSALRKLVTLLDRYERYCSAIRRAS